MKLNDEDELLIRQFLLNRLAENERAQVEDRLMTDQTYLNRIEYAEEVLRDDYVHGRLSVEDERNFEASFTTDRERRQDVEFTGALSWYARTKEKEAASEAGEAKWWRTAFIFTGFIKPVPASERQIKPHEVSLALIPGLVRSEGRTSSVVLPADTRELRLELALEKAKNYQTYRTELRTVEGEVIDGREHLTIEQSDAGRFLPLTIPTSSLSENDYILMLSGMNDENVYEKIGTYFFVIREDE
jgi:hypothetical protein